MDTTVSRPRLPSVDWIAFGVGMLATVMQFMYSPLVSLVAFAVFMPSVLREIGLLKDVDEYTRQIMHRAGFHAVLAAAVLIFLNHFLPAVGWYKSISPFADSIHSIAESLSDKPGPAVPFADEILRRTIVWTFLLSYLIQYWGARAGVFRILLGVAFMELASMAVLFRMPEGRTYGFLVLAASAVVMIGLAFVVRRWPRVGGGLLVFLFAGFLCMVFFNIRDREFAWPMVSTLIQALLLLGVTGIALLREYGSDSNSNL